MKCTSFAKLLFWLLLLLFLPSRDLTAQVDHPYEEGAIGLTHLVKQLNTDARILMIGAHPDDEDTALLTYLARGEGARTAYLSLTRGDGGQNILGPELGSALGIIRTEELMQARRLDGAEQFFTRANDFGFSKSLDETRSRWDEGIILCDVVRTIRQFRPHVVISIFGGTPSDGHGHHQFAGYISPKAVAASAALADCPGSGKVWDVGKIYVRYRGDREPSLQINTGKFDPVYGRSYFEIAMEARSQHKSQEQGVLELKGEQFSQLRSMRSGEGETGIFGDLDTSLRGLAEKTNNSSLLEKLTGLDRLTVQLETSYDPRKPEKILEPLTEGFQITERLYKQTVDGALRSVLDRKRKLFSDAIVLAAGIQIDALVGRETIVAGESVTAVVNVFAPEKSAISIKGITMQLPAGWKAARVQQTAEVQPGRLRERPIFRSEFRIETPGFAALTQPYWLRRPLSKDLYFWDNDENQATPFQGPVASALIEATIAGRPVSLAAPIEYRYADETRGEVRRSLNVVPRLTVELDRDLVIVPTSNREQTRRFVVSVTNHAELGSGGTVDLTVTGARWHMEEPRRTFELQAPGSKNAFVFEVKIPGNTPAGTYEVEARAIISGGLDPTVYPLQMHTIRYPHIQLHRYYTRAKTQVRIFDVQSADAKVGYIMGSGDTVPDAIHQLGLDLSMIGEKELSSGDLSRYDVVVAGIRATEVRPDLVANSPRLHDYVRNGGTLIVQYQRPGTSLQQLLPYPAEAGPRVTDENALVTILEPSHRIFNFPNRITGEDFRGWVQERNLYNFSKYDQRYLPLLEAHDRGEPPNSGGLVLARVGKGNFVYFSYSLFRQLPAGVPGAYRLLANLMSLPKAESPIDEPHSIESKRE